MRHALPRSYPKTAPPEKLGALPLAPGGIPKDAVLLLKTGLWLMATGIAAAVLIEAAFGGIHHHGPHTNGGWLLLVVAMSCVPLGIMASLLGGAKWLGNRRR